MRSRVLSVEEFVRVRALERVRESASLAKAEPSVNESVIGSMWRGFTSAVTLSGWLTDKIKNIFGLKTKLLDACSRRYEELLKNSVVVKEQITKDITEITEKMISILEHEAELYDDELGTTKGSNVLMDVKALIGMLRQKQELAKKKGATTAHSKLLSMISDKTSDINDKSSGYFKRISVNEEYQDLKDELLKKYPEMYADVDMGDDLAVLVLPTRVNDAFIDKYEIERIFNNASSIYMEYDEDGSRDRRRTNVRLEKYWKNLVLSVQSKYQKYFSKSDMEPGDEYARGYSGDMTDYVPSARKSKDPVDQQMREVVSSVGRRRIYIASSFEAVDSKKLFAPVLSKQKHYLYVRTKTNDVLDSRVLMRQVSNTEQQSVYVSMPNVILQNKAQLELFAGINDSTGQNSKFLPVSFNCYMVVTKLKDAEDIKVEMFRESNHTKVFNASEFAYMIVNTQDFDQSPDRIRISAISKHLAKS